MISELTGVDAGEVAPADRLMEDLGMDSLQSMELLSRLSEEYEIDPDMDDVQGVQTVADVVAFLQRELAKA
jgi:acyl carrier protein